MSEKISVIIADDEPTARTSIEILISSIPDCEIVTSCKDGKETYESMIKICLNINPM